MGTFVRFDDRLATVMAAPATTAAAREAKWRQLVDLLAQRKEDGGEGAIVEALAYLRQHRTDIGLARREETARSIAGRAVSIDLLAFFAEDVPSVAGPLLLDAPLDPDAWLALLPRLDPTARSLLRQRRDLGPRVGQALGALGNSDVVPANAVEPAPEPRPGEATEAQIRDLVARIDAFRNNRGNEQPAPPSSAVQPAPEPAPTNEPVDGFRWETGPDGVILWVDNAPRGPLVGQSIASIGKRGHYGVDGQAAGAFEKRAPFRDARFRVAGSGPAAGDWRISGVPFFDPGSGSFTGYRGSARRPRRDEVARPDSAAEPPRGLFGTDIPADSLRQLIHELRTPLNAIVGFAEMIDGQYMGPAGANYRARAGEIMAQANRLLSAVDDLDAAARIETARPPQQESAADVVALMSGLQRDYESIARERRSGIAIEIEPDLPAARVEAETAERMFARMLAATIGLAREGETISATMRMDQFGPRRMLCLAIDRPQAIAGIGEAALLDPGYSPDGDWPGAPALGLGFALRLVRNLAEAVGGGLVIGESRFSLYLPTVETTELSSEHSS